GRKEFGEGANLPGKAALGPRELPGGIHFFLLHCARRMVEALQDKCSLPPNCLTNRQIVLQHSGPHKTAQPLRWVQPSQATSRIASASAPRCRDLPRIPARSQVRCATGAPRRYCGRGTYITPRSSSPRLFCCERDHGTWL